MSVYWLTSISSFTYRRLSTIWGPGEEENDEERGEAEFDVRRENFEGLRKTKGEVRITSMLREERTSRGEGGRSERCGEVEFDV